MAWRMHSFMPVFLAESDRGSTQVWALQGVVVKKGEVFRGHTPQAQGTHQYSLQYIWVKATHTLIFAPKVKITS